MDQSKRNLAKAFGVAGAGVLAWKKPVVQGVVLPVHAMTSACGGITAISIESLDPPNDFPRYAILVDENDEYVEGDGEVDNIMVTASNLPAGTYRVFGDSAGPNQHEVTITAVGCGSLTNTVTTTDAGCRNLIATVELPSGVITADNGELVTGDWGCTPDGAGD